MPLEDSYRLRCFSGSGTVGAIAAEFGAYYLGYDTNENFNKNSRQEAPCTGDFNLKVSAMKRFIKWKIRSGIRLYNWGYPVTKIIRWRINLSIRIHNGFYPEEELIPLLK